MEYRRRRHRAYRTAGNSAWRSYAAVALVFAGVVYLIGVSKLGTWLANSLFAPAWRMVLAATDTASTTPTPDDGVIVLATKDVVTETVTFPALTCCALQIGVYAEPENAERQAEILQTQGAAGYIVQDAERYRVLAAGYPSAESLDKVRLQLLESGVESTRYVFPCIERTWAAESTAEQLECLMRAAETLPTVPKRLYDLAIAYDRDGLSTEAARQTLSTLYAELGARIDDLSDLSETNAETEALSETLFAVQQSVTSVMEANETDTPRFSASLKRLYLDAFVTYASFTAGV